MKKSIAIDMDGVIADIEPHLIKWYQKETGIITTKETIRGLGEGEAFADKEAIHKILNSPSFFRTVPVMDNAVEILKALMEEYEIFIVSAAMEFPLSLLEKKEWLSEHFPFISWKNIIFCGDKSVIDTDFMIDDYCKNLDFCKGKPLMFTAYHNVDLNHHQRIDHWNEVPELLKRLS
jgi:5'(3')-deoxyribonucleotidase